MTKPRKTVRRLAILDDWSGTLKDGWRSPQILLLLFAAASPIAFETWSVLINNFVVEKAAFTGREIGFLQAFARYRASSRSPSSSCSSSGASKPSRSSPSR